MVVTGSMCQYYRPELQETTGTALGWKVLTAPRGKGKSARERKRVCYFFGAFQKIGSGSWTDGESRNRGKSCGNDVSESESANEQ